MRTAGVRELKAKLSEYLRDVARGETILVTDRGRVVAELRAPSPPAQDVDPDARRIHDLMARGLLLRPALTKDRSAFLNLRGPGFPPGTAKRLIDEDRGE
ncbi:MAG: type II toxin-antitoxin system Phd/YefM family antitoxin [Myxococcales bacterium]